MSTPARHPGNATSMTDEAPGTEGNRVVVVAALAVVATFVACLVFFQGFLDIARLPGDVPAINQIPHNAQTSTGLSLMHWGSSIGIVAALLALAGLVLGIRAARRPDSFRRGVWAIALSACTPVLAVMLLAGMGAT